MDSNSHYSDSNSSTASSSMFTELLKSPHILRIHRASNAFIRRHPILHAQLRRIRNDRSALLRLIIALVLVSAFLIGSLGLLGDDTDALGCSQETWMHRQKLDTKIHALPGCQEDANVLHDLLARNAKTNRRTSSAWFTMPFRSKYSSKDSHDSDTERVDKHLNHIKDQAENRAHRLLSLRQSIHSLIIVCGHAVYHGSKYLDGTEDEIGASIPIDQLQSHNEMYGLTDPGNWFSELTTSLSISQDSPSFQDRKDELTHARAVSSMHRAPPEAQKRKLRVLFDHMRTGVDLAGSNPHAMLMFSGGMTQMDAGPRTEAESYWLVANAMPWGFRYYSYQEDEQEQNKKQQQQQRQQLKQQIMEEDDGSMAGLENLFDKPTKRRRLTSFWKRSSRPSSTTTATTNLKDSNSKTENVHPKDWIPLRERTFTEDFARDSFENLLFSICRFRQITGSYPKNITVISFEFKRKRFENLHRKALRYPAMKFQFRGIDSVDIDDFVKQRELANAVRPFQKDPYACVDPHLRQKKIDRNPFFRFHPYPNGCPEISDLFMACERRIFKGPLPW